MKIYESAVKKPIMTILVFIGVIILGLFSLRNLSVDLLPKIDMNMWERVSEESHTADEKNEYDYTFVEYRRK